MKPLSREELIALQRQYTHYKGLPLYEVALRRLETLEFVLGRAPTDEERAQAVEATGAVVVLGVTYTSLAAACRAHKIYDATVHKRARRKGLTLVQALENIIRGGVQARIVAGEVVVNGVPYASLNAACRAHKVNAGTVHSRAQRKGLALVQALEQIIRGGIQAPTIVGAVVVDGVEHASLTAARRAHNIGVTAIYSRAKRNGITPAQALEQIIRGGIRAPTIVATVVVSGVEYASLAAACHAHEISPSTVHSRAKAQGIPQVQALEQIVRDGLRGVVVLGVPYASLNAACRARKVNAGTVQSRAKAKGVTPVQALEQIIRDGVVTRVRVAVVVNGDEHASLTAACRAHNISRATVRSRAQRMGITPAQALEQIIRDGVDEHKVGVAVVVSGVEYASLAAACRAHKTSPSTVRNHVKARGITPAQALEQLIAERQLQAAE